MKTVTCLLLILILTGFATQAMGCPNCSSLVTKAAKVSMDVMPQAQVASLANGFFWSILLMMSLPFLCVGGFGGAIWLHHRKRAARTNLPS